MALISLFNIDKHYDVKKLLEDVSFNLNEGERIAIVGQNGCGKSTLMKIITGEEEPTEGKRVINQNIEIGMLSQQPKFKASLRVKDAIENELKELKEAKNEYDKISLLLSKDYENKRLLARQAELITFIDHHNAWSLDDKIERVLQEFKLKEYENRLIITLSGGEQRRVALASLILKKPDILLLDEPTNHLDVYMVEFLEEILLKDKFTLIVISHDRYFIDRIATKIIEVENRKLISYIGGYTNYLSLKEERIKSLTKEHENLLKFLKQEEEWLAKGVRAREKRNQKRKKRVYELQAKAKINPTIIRKMKIELEREKRTWNGDKAIAKKKILFDIENLSYSIANKNLIKNFSTRIIQKDKIAIVGANGSGKSTMLKLIMGNIKPDSGIIKHGEFKIGYFDQHREMLNDTKSLIETFCPNGGDIIKIKGENRHVYGYLKSFLFPEEYLDKKIGVLSGGEKNRVALAWLLAQDVDCLILDEPTNDLDILTINILEEKLINFLGAVLFVSHDRYFIDKIASKLFIFKGNGVIEESFQNYSEYLIIEKEINELDTIVNNNNNNDNKIISKPKPQKVKTKLSFKEQRAYDNLPDEIEKLENRIEELKKCLTDPKCYNQKGLTEIGQELIKLEEIYELKTNEYLELLELLERININNKD